MAQEVFYSLFFVNWDCVWFIDDQNCVYVHLFQLVDKLNTDSNISDMQMDYNNVSCYVTAILA